MPNAGHTHPSSRKLNKGVSVMAENMRKPKQKYTGTNQQQQEAIVGWLMIAPAFLLLCLFLLYPFFTAFTFFIYTRRTVICNDITRCRNYYRCMQHMLYLFKPNINKVQIYKKRVTKT